MHAMHEMQPVVADVHGVCPSVCLSVTWLNSASLCKKTYQDAVWGKDSWEPWNTEVLIPPQTGGGGLFLNFGTPSISGTAKGRDLRFCVHTEATGPNENKMQK